MKRRKNAPPDVKTRPPDRLQADVVPDCLAATWAAASARGAPCARLLGCDSCFCAAPSPADAAADAKVAESAGQSSTGHAVCARAMSGLSSPSKGRSASARGMCRSAPCQMHAQPQQQRCGSVPLRFPEALPRAPAPLARPRRPFASSGHEVATELPRSLPLAVCCRTCTSTARCRAT